MKTLDEVIKAFEYTYENDPIAWTYGVDALHYLKEYQGYLIGKEISEAFDEAFTEIYNNSPLTWNELKKMEGKPVWIEHDSSSTKYQRWVLVCEYTDANKITIIANHLLTQIMPDEYGKTWQAYRKERK